MRPVWQLRRSTAPSVAASYGRSPPQGGEVRTVWAATLSARLAGGDQVPGVAWNAKVQSSDCVQGGAPHQRWRQLLPVGARRAGRLLGRR